MTGNPPSSIPTPPPSFGTICITAARRPIPGRGSSLSVSLDADDPDEDGPPRFLEPFTPDGVNELLGRIDTADLLADCKRRYTGVARLGVEALELKVKGLSGADIAQMYHTTPNNVGAWISRAAQKIRKDIAI